MNATFAYDARSGRAVVSVPRDKDAAVVEWALSFLWANLDDEVRDMLRENKITVKDVAKALDKRGIEHAPNP